MRFSLNTIGLFPGLSFEQIFPRMRQSGFDTFELWSLENVDTAALRQAMDRHGVRLSAFCQSFFVLNDPARQEEYSASSSTRPPAARPTTRSAPRARICACARSASPSVRRRI